jgi:predicted NUDIX family phosphoesterase
MSKLDEKVLCFDSKFVGGFTLKNQGRARDLDNLWAHHCYNNSFFVTRRECEGNPQYKQIIPYVVIYRMNKFFSYKRMGSEKRLFDMYSLGIGGHINPCDFGTSFSDTIRNNVYREMGEEISVDLSVLSHLWPNNFFNFPRKVIYLEDKMGAVNSDHLGLLYTLHWPGEDLRIKDEGTDSKFRTYEDLSSLTLEDWSKDALTVF